MASNQHLYYMLYAAPIDRATKSTPIGLSDFSLRCSREFNKKGLIASRYFQRVGLELTRNLADV